VERLQGNLLVDKDEAFDRLVMTPQKRGGHVIMRTCDQSGALSTRIVAKSDGPVVYKEARKAAWGDGFAFPDESSKRELAGKVRPKAFKYRSLAKVGHQASSSPSASSRRRSAKASARGAEPTTKEDPLVE
jgi:ribosomal protein RSM22 (predicted rRNA methylase)